MCPAGPGRAAVDAQDVVRGSERAGGPLRPDFGLSGDVESWSNRCPDDSGRSFPSAHTTKTALCGAPGIRLLAPFIPRPNRDAASRVEVVGRVTGGPLRPGVPRQRGFRWLGWKPGFGLSGEVHPSQTCSRRPLNYFHAMGTDTLSPQRAESLCYILLLPSASPVYH